MLKQKWRMIQKKIKAKWPQFVFLDDAQYMYLLAGLVFFAGVLLLGWFGYGAISKKLSKKYSAEMVVVTTSAPFFTKQIPCSYHRLLDGVCVQSQDAIDPELVAVMVENAADAWPLSGLSQASVVYEALVESNIPRYMALYPISSSVTKVGPVRSARPYYLDWLGEYPRVMYMHVGGSQEALDSLQALNIFDVDEISRGWYFWRDKQRDVPHNTYTSAVLWQKAWDDYGPKAVSDFEPWIFADTDTCTLNCANTVSIDLSSSLYNITWKYVSSSHAYERYQDSRGRYRDTQGNTMFADTVIVQYVPYTVIDDIGRKRVQTTGSGEVIIFRKGHAIKGVWRKHSRTDRTEFLTQSGESIALQPGKIWVEILPVTTDVSWE